ncbi:HD domain-containing protein [Paenibacillus sp. FSL R5-0887]|uniref:HD domain-containing protein n=1 Tax=Paenibacillus TaxID=44249 RepID=UPI00096EBEE6|nr:HD domain-containing protein [Paenibacillus odorifer]OMC75392.1 phosphohydrolase [Paenibacillus odorifer]OMD80251.1 phosphohydrolase [Paenibacillus odorifer]OMD85230.1 phosphohydrolase [Paenibacillus odorifer]
MNQPLIIARAEEFVKEQLGQDTTGHDWWHTHRVRSTACEIAEIERADIFICTMAALLHDVADEKLNPSKEAGLLKVHTWLTANLTEEEQIRHIMLIVETMSFSGGGGEPMQTLEGQVVQDADRLDALGAIGIARTFIFSGAKGRPAYDPEVSPREESLQKEYRDYSKGTAVNHFYEKLLKLKFLMNTAYGRKLAEERHDFMLNFLDQFYKEWNQGRQ